MILMKLLVFAGVAAVIGVAALVVAFSRAAKRIDRQAGERMGVGLVVVALLCAAPLSAAPIYSNLGDDVIVAAPPDYVHFWSTEDFRTGAFHDLVFTGFAIMANQTDPFTWSFDGRFHHAIALYDPCYAWQFDADAHDFAGIGRLIRPQRAGCFDSPLVPLVPVTTSVPAESTPVPEPSTLALLAIGLVLCGWRR